MDGTDARILRFFASPHGFQPDLRPSYAEAARQIGLHEDTVRARMARMEQDGLLQGWDIMVNPSVLGMELVRIEVPVPDGATKEAALAQAADVDGTRLTLDYQQTGFVWVGYVMPASRARVCRLLGSMAGVAATVRALAVPPAGAMPAGGWGVLRALRGDLRRDLADAAAHLGVTPRTVRRRIEAIVAARVAFVLVRVDFDRLTGSVPFEMRLKLGPHADHAAVREAVLALENLIFVNLGGDECVASVMAPNAAAASRQRDSLAALPGVEVRMDMLRRRVVHDAWLDEELERRAGAERARQR